MTHSYPAVVTDVVYIKHSRKHEKTLCRTDSIFCINACLIVIFRPFGLVGTKEGMRIIELDARNGQL